MTAVMEEMVEAPAPTSSEEALTLLRTVGSDSEVIANVALVQQIERLERQCAEVSATIAAEREEHERWISSLEETAGDKAEEGEWCGVFEEKMDAIGLTAIRPHTTIEARATIEVSYGMDSGDAENVFDAINGRDSAPGSFSAGSSVVTCSLEVSASVEVRGGECGCSEVDWDDYLPDWVKNYCSWEEEASDCDNCN